MARSSEVGMAFTPGPWVQREGRDTGYYYITSAGRDLNRKVEIAKVSFGWSDPIGSEQEANARLIASAPQLYAFAEEMRVAGNMKAAALLKSINGDKT